MTNQDSNGSRKGLKLVVVGGVAGGASFAARARRLDETAEILLLQVSLLASLEFCMTKVVDPTQTPLVAQSGPDVSFASCGMPYFIGGEITDRNQVRGRLILIY